MLRLAYFSGITILVLLSCVLFSCYENLPASIPIFQTPTGKVLIVASKSPRAVARLPLMHLVFLSIIMIVAVQLAKDENWKSFALQSLCLAALKGVFELLQLIFQIELLGWGVVFWVLIFLGMLFVNLQKNKFHFDFKKLKLPRSYMSGLYLGLFVYFLLVLFPFWL